MKTHHRTSIPALLLASFMAFDTPRAIAASPSELLEKGIYTDETKGDVDTAIAIYIARPSDPASRLIVRFAGEFEAV